MNEGVLKIMKGLNLVYYGFGGFMGFICGVGINLIFYAVEKSGNPILSNLVQKYGLIGHYIVEMVNALPFFGIALGIVMVRILFREQLDQN